MMKPVKASVIVLAWNGTNHLEACLESLLAQDETGFELIVVDNGSTDGSADLVAERFPAARLLRNEQNLGFAGGCNVGLRAAQGEVLVLLNQDMVVEPGWLAALVKALTDEEVGIVGAKLLEMDGRTFSHAGAYLEWPLVLGRHLGVDEADQGQYDRATDVEFVTGASLAVKRAVLEEIGPLDERFYPAYFEDVDWCWRARRAGWRVRYEPRAVAWHDEASSTRHHWPSKHYYHYRNKLLFLLKHYPPRQILGEFVPAEEERISHLPPDELRAGQVALAEVLAMWPLVSQDLPATDPSAVAGEAAAEIDAVRQALRGLREHIVRWQGGDPALVKPRPAGGTGGTMEPEAQARFQSRLSQVLVDELLALWEIPEPTFTSQVPVLGPLIVVFRRMWNSVATKWFVRPMMRQQVQFNGAVVRALSAAFQTQASYWDSDAFLVMLAERSGRLTARLAALEAHLENLAGNRKGVEK